MKHLAISILVLAATLTGCRSNKEIAIDTSLSIDSVIRSEHHRTIALRDSVMHSIHFNFDTLNIEIQRPLSSLGSCPSAIIRLKATKGRVIDRRSVQRESVEVTSRIDTATYHHATAETSTGHTATTRLYNPPDGNVIIAFALLIIAAGLILYVRKQLSP